MGKIKKKSIYSSRSDNIFFMIVNSILFIVLVIVLIPMLNIIASSFSSGNAVAAGRVFIWPVDFSLEGYKAVFRNNQVLSGYANTIYYTFFGTLINVIMTVLAAYPLSRSDFYGRNFITFLFTFTMLFSGGIIPNYLLMKDLGLIDTRWAMLLPNAITVYNMIITRTYFQTTIPNELLEASRLDGCSDIKFLILIVMPLSKAIIAVITLYYAVTHWNMFFNAYIYLNRKELFPLQLILRDILLANSIDPSMMTDPVLLKEKQNLTDLLKYSLIIVASLPVWCIYPFVQKYFVQGVMIGSIKG